MDRFLKCVPVFKFFQAISVCSHLVLLMIVMPIFSRTNSMCLFGMMGSFFILLFVLVKTCRAGRQERRPALQAILYSHILVTRCGYRGVAGGIRHPLTDSGRGVGYQQTHKGLKVIFLNRIPDFA